MTPDDLLSKALRIRGFSRSQIQKIMLRTEVEMKAAGHLNTTKNWGRTVSQDNLPSSDAMNKITATSETLTAKEVS